MGSEERLRSAEAALRESLDLLLHALELAQDAAGEISRVRTSPGIQPHAESPACLRCRNHYTIP